MASARYQFYEVVRVVSDNPELAEIRGETGPILGMSQDDEGRYDYGVFIDRDGICWSIAEGDLETTGVVRSREEFYGDSSIRVSVDAQGRGRIVD